MKIIITGSLGHISKPLTEKLLQQGHDITVISSKAEKQADIEALGAKAAIGSIDDAAFLTEIFTGADAVYVMEPPFSFFDHNTDMESYWLGIARAYKTAIAQSGVKRVVHLSSIGAHTNTGVGMLAAHHKVENILRELPEDVAIAFMRPVGFYYNIFAFIPAIKHTGAISANYGGDEKEPWVAPLDIADAIAEQIVKPFTGRSVRYIASDEISPNGLAKLLGEAIGKPDLKWNVISDEEQGKTLLNIGMSPAAAKGYTEMNAARVQDTLYADYNLNKPQLGKVKLTDFVKDFTAAYNRN